MNLLALAIVGAVGVAQWELAGWSLGGYFALLFASPPFAAVAVLREIAWWLLVVRALEWLADEREPGDLAA